MPETKIRIGRLERHALRDAWPREDADFTPWLAAPENLSLLSDALGLGDLEDIRTEVPIGSFSADILCRDMDGAEVVIENQIERSDHTHLGQVLTYLSGSEARTIVWITRIMREEHRAALDWLNENTAPEFSFFGVELELWRIGDSAPAPKFEVVCRPNAWVRAQKQKTRRMNPEDHQRRIEYWDALLTELPADPRLVPPANAPAQGWLKLAFAAPLRVPGSSIGIYFYRMIDRGRVGAYLSIGRHDPAHFGPWAETLNGFSALAEGDGAGWHVNKSGICQFFQTLPADALDETDWPRQHAWMFDQARAFLADWEAGLRAQVLALIDDGAASDRADAT